LRARNAGFQADHGGEIQVTNRARRVVVRLEGGKAATLPMVQ
jgi:hypothetical protein